MAQTPHVTEKTAAGDHATDLELMQHVVQNSPMVVFRWRAAEGWPVDYVSENVSLFGYGATDLMSGKIPFSAMVHPDDLDRVGTEVAAYSGRGVDDFAQSYRLVTPTGEVRWIDDWTRVIRNASGEITYYQGVVLDVTDRKRVERDLWIAQSIVKNSSLALFRIDEEARVKYVNPTACRQLGYTQEELLGMSIPDFDPSWTMAFWKNQGLPFLQKHNEGHFESFHRRKDGSEFPVEIHSYRIQFEGEFYFVSTAIDISQRKRDEAELAAVNKRLTESESVLRATLESTRDGILVVDENGKVSHFNQRFSDIWSIPADLLATGDDHLLIAHVLPQLANPEQFSSSTAEIYRSSAPSEDTLRFKDGRIVERSSFTLIRDQKQSGRVWFFRDVTEKARMQEMMIQSEKMLSVGGLAAGMAHEINNPLAGIMQTAGVLTHRLGSGADIPANHSAAQAAGTNMAVIETYMRSRGIPEMLNAISDSGQRVAETVANMLSFARKGEAVVSTHRLEQLIDKTLGLAATDYDLKNHFDFKQIELVKRYALDLPGVPCEAAKIQQVLLNILRNGAQAMQAAGTASPRFIIRTRLDAERLMAEIEITDNGPGMDEKIRKRVFEPFFTTKPEGTGTGLGLSVSYFIITDNHRGELTLQSQPGRGTTFIIRLPINGAR